MCGSWPIYDLAHVEQIVVYLCGAEIGQREKPAKATLDTSKT